MQRVGVVLMFLAGVGCGTETSTCVPGSTQACLCVGGGMGVQECNASGVFDTCVCGEQDAGSGVDGGPSTRDAGPLDDAGPAADAGVGSDSGAPVDAGAGSPDAGEPPDTVYEDCEDVGRAGITADGQYWIDRDGSGPLAPSLGYCDMTTDGGGWTLVYKIRNDVPDVLDPWWAQVGLGSGDAFPSTRDNLPSGTYFEGPTREVRAAYWSLRGTEARSTMTATDGTVLADFRATSFQTTTAFLAMGRTGNPSACPTGISVGGRGTIIYHPDVDPGTVVQECHWQNGASDMIRLRDDVVLGPIAGDDSIASEYVGTTTFFWVR